MSIKTRPLTEKERNYLKEHFPSVIPFRSLLLISFPIFCWCYFAYFIIKLLLDIADFEMTEIYNVYLIVIIALFALAFFRKLLYPLGKNRKELKNILSRNQAEVYELDIQRYAEVEDEGIGVGVGFFLETSRNGVLFVSGRDLNCYSSDYGGKVLAAKRPYGENFPSSRVTFIREAVSNIRLDIISNGEKITDVLKLGSVSYTKEIKGEIEYIGPEDGRFYNGALEDVLASFEIKPKS